MFPFSFSRTIEVPLRSNNVESTTKMILRTIEGYIRAEEPNTISSNEHQIVFSDSVPPFRFILSWNLLRMIDRGVIEIMLDGQRLLISYKLWFTELFISASLLSVAFMLCSFSSGFTFPKLAIALGIGLFYFGVGFIRTIIGFHDLIHSAIKV